MHGHYPCLTICWIVKEKLPPHTPLSQCDARSLLRVVEGDGINSGRRPELTHSTAFPERISLERMETRVTRQELTSSPTSRAIEWCIHVSHDSAAVCIHHILSALCRPNKFSEWHWRCSKNGLGGPGISRPRSPTLSSLRGAILSFANWRPYHLSHLAAQPQV